MKFELGFGDSTQQVVVDDKNLQAVIKPNKITHKYCGAEAIDAAIESPIGTPKLREIVNPGEKIAIVTSDITRPMPTYKVMPSLLKELYKGGVKKDDITLVFALGSHRKHTEKEMRHLAGDAYDEIKCIDSDPSDCINLGRTKLGTPVDITRTVAQADRRICLGNIEYHYFAGYSGGAKAIMPGCSTPDAIQSNHSKMVKKDAHAGKLKGNPVREDIEEATDLVGVDYILNVVLDEHKEIIFAVAGDVKLAHREGCKFLDKLYKTKIDKRADVVIVSQGGAPKDINLYQTQKALDNSKHAVRDGGTVILVGSCKEGFGNERFKEWIISAETPHSLIERVNNDFQLGGHKAAAIAMVLEHAEISIVSDMPDELVRRIFMHPFKTLQDAYDAAIEKYGDNASVIVMPYGGSTLPTE